VAIRDNHKKSRQSQVTIDNERRGNRQDLDSAIAAIHGATGTDSVTVTIGMRQQLKTILQQEEMRCVRKSESRHRKI
jgi:hypothetical protein